MELELPSKANKKHHHKAEATNFLKGDMGDNRDPWFGGLNTQFPSPVIPIRGH